MNEKKPEDEIIPEVMPQLQIPEKDVAHDVPIEVIDGALAELIRKEKRDGGKDSDVEQLPTLQ